MHRLIALLLVGTLGCAPSTADIPNDEPVASRDAGRDAKVIRDAKATAPSDDDDSQADDSQDDDVSDETAPDEDNTDDASSPRIDASVPDASRKDAESTAPEEDADTTDPEPKESKIAGTYGMCTSYTKMSGDQCFGYYCKATEADIAAETVAGAGPCSAVDPALLCEGLTSQEVGECSRSVKSDPANAFASKEELRELVGACVYKVARIKQGVPQQCLECYLDSAGCASDNCLIQCLPGDSKECDKCRTESGCNSPVPACAGLPSPF